MLRAARSVVLKTTESAFTNFVRDKYTTLKEVDDRIFSTSVDLSYTFAPIDLKAPTDAAVEEFVVPVRPPRTFLNCQESF